MGGWLQSWGVDELMWIGEWIGTWADGCIGGEVHELVWVA